jgi:hypothetical protein
VNPSPRGAARGGNGADRGAGSKVAVSPESWTWTAPCDGRNQQRCRREQPRENGFAGAGAAEIQHAPSSSAASVVVEGTARSPMPPSVAAALEVTHLLTTQSRPWS